MSNLLQSRVLVATVTGDGGGISGSAAYSDAIDTRNASAIKVRLAYTKSTIDVTVGLVDASASSSATISGTYDPILSTRQSTGASATTHTINATGRALIVANLGGVCGAVRLAITGSGGGAVGDSLTYEVTIAEEG